MLDLRRQRHCRQRGFSIVELILVVAIIGLIASIVIPNLLNALHKVKQRRTMAELRGIGVAWMNWFTDQHGVSAAGASQTYPLSDFQEQTYAEIFGYLHPSDSFFYMQDIPQFDPWGSEIKYFMNDNPLSDSQLLLCSVARDGIAQHCDGGTDIPIGPFVSTDFDQDIIWADGFLVRWPNI